ncbi:MAG: hypothetical protein H7308_10520 [Chthonomonadaceae bacterium]|nr:hypothetical protein [Chthonomonadaceae bacterium]
MSNLPRSTEELSPQIPQRITRLLVWSASRRRKLSPSTTLFLEFVQNEAATTQPDPETFAALCDTLLVEEYLRWRQQMIAIWALGQADLTEEQRKEATKLLAFQLDSRRKGRGQQLTEGIVIGVVSTGAWIIACVTLLATMIETMSYFDRRFDHGTRELVFIPQIFGGLSILCTPVVPFVIFALRGKRAMQIRLETARSLGPLGKAEGVPALLRASQNVGFFVKVGQGALERTLPSLNFEEHYGTLSSDAVPNLCRLLKQSDRPDIVGVVDWQLLLLDALEKVGDARAIDSVMLQTIAHRETLLHRPIVCERAAQVLEVLKERAARETEQETLPRGSVAPVLPETLLRSYEGAIETPPEQLLRASNEEKDRE